MVGCVGMTDTSNNFKQARKLIILDQKQSKRLLTPAELCFLIAIVAFMVKQTIPAYADGTQLTAILASNAFHGNWAVIKSYSIIGWVLNYIISVFCFFGLVLTMYRVIASLLYLSCRTFWNQVHQIKEQNKGKGFGFIKLAKATFTGEGGTGGLNNVGLDAILIFIFGLFPDIKQHCDYAEGEGANPKFDAINDTPLSYILKTFFPIVLTIFFFTIGFSGTLPRAYGTVVGGLAAFADTLVSVNLYHIVHTSLQYGYGYNFTLGLTGTPMGKAQLNIAEQIYRSYIGRYNVTSTVDRDAVGAAIENWVRSNVTAGRVSSATGVSNITDNSGNDWNNLKAKVFYISQGSNIQQSNVLQLPCSQISSKTPQGSYGVELALQASTQVQTPFNGTPAAGTVNY